jgi:hypothetical protein
MSCLSERERVALEDIFLSISVNESPYEKCKSLYSSFSPFLREKAKHLKSYTYAKLFLQRKREKLGHHFRFSRHK